MRTLAWVVVATFAGAVEFRQPVVGDVVVTAYYDLGGTQDWNCGAHTYAGHRGTDLGIIGRFAAQDEGRDVVAGADGRVTRTHDGEFDRCTTGNCAGGGGFGNHVVIEHDDGKVTYYAHLRRGSVAVAQGQQVRCGDRLGQVGSSGFSTGPHLHFEVRVGGAADDPFTGRCGGPLSYWVQQGAYRALPSAECRGGAPPPPPPPPQRPDMHLEASWSLTGERRCDFEGCDDFARGGRSGGVFDAWVGDAVELRVVVHNRGDGPTAGESEGDAAVTFAYQIPDGFEPTGYVVETDHPEMDRSSWRRNDAMDNPANPPEGELPRAGRLRLNGFSPGEAKRVRLRLRAARRTVGEGRTEVRTWIAHLRNYYGEKDGWDDGVETNNGQTFNGGDLRVAGRVDVFDRRRFLFDGGDEALLEAWRICGEGGLRVDTDAAALVVSTDGAAPCLESPILDLDVAGIAGVRLTLAHDADTSMGRLTWNGGEVAFRTTGDGDAEPLHLGPAWGGVVERIRLYPLGDAPYSGEVRVRSVELVDDAPPGPPPPPADGAGLPDPPDARDGAADGSGADAAPDEPAGDAEPGESKDDAGTEAGDGRASGDTVHVEGGCAQAPPGGPLWWWLLVGLGARRARRFISAR